jgi:hypothetical protein
MSRKAISDLSLFKEKYLEQNLTIPECARFFNCGLNTVIRFAKKNNIVKDRKLVYENISKSNLKHDHDLIEKMYIEENLTRSQIALKLGIKKGAIDKAIAMAKIKKNKDQKITNSIKFKISKEELYDLYIENNLSVYEISKRFKVSKSCLESKLKKFNIKKPESLRSELVVKKLIDKGVCLTVENKNLKEISKITGFSNSYLTKMSHTYASLGKVLTIDELSKMREENVNSLEKLFAERLKLEKFDKKTGLNFGYQPDFKINDRLYVNLDGIYWHSDKFRSKDYHLNMRRSYEENGARILQFLETEVIGKTNIVESIVNNLTNKSSRIYARKCTLKSVESNVAELFLTGNHLMGATKAKHIGLYYRDEIVCLFSYKLYGKTLKVERFCSKINTCVVGGFSKILNHMEKLLSPEKIEYWVDLRYGTGEYLEKIGFNKSHETLGWKWTNFKKVFNRRYCRANMDSRRLSEKQHAEELKLHKIYDAGQRLFVKALNHA